MSKEQIKICSQKLTILRADMAAKYGAPVYSLQPPTTAILPANQFATHQQLSTAIYFSAVPEAGCIALGTTSTAVHYDGHLHRNGEFRSTENVTFNCSKL